jgi:transposase
MYTAHFITLREIYNDIIEQKFEYHFTRGIEISLHLHCNIYTDSFLHSSFTL